MDTPLSAAGVSTAHAHHPEAIKGEGFESGSGGFAFLWVGGRKLPAAEVRAAISTLYGDKPRTPQEPPSGETQADLPSMEEGQKTRKYIVLRKSQPDEAQPATWGVFTETGRFTNLCGDTKEEATETGENYFTDKFTVEPLYLSASPQPPALSKPIKGGETFTEEQFEAIGMIQEITDRADAMDLGLVKYPTEQIKLLLAALASIPSQTEGQEDWRDDPSSDERWNAGLDYAMDQFCVVLDVDKSQVNWDAATETLDGDVQAVIWNIIRAKFGESFEVNDLMAIEAMLSAGQGDDDGAQILPAFQPYSSLASRVEACVHLLEKRRDVIAARSPVGDQS